MSLISSGIVLPSLISIVALGLLGIGLARPEMLAKSSKAPAPEANQQQQVASQKNSKQSRKNNAEPTEPTEPTEPAEPTEPTEPAEPQAARNPPQQARVQVQQARSAARKGSYDNVPPFEPVKSST